MNRRLLTCLPLQQSRAGFRPDCLLGIMRSALNVSPFCCMIGEALTSAPAVISLAKVKRVYADDWLFALSIIRLIDFALFRHLPVVWSVFRFAVSVVGMCVQSRLRLRLRNQASTVQRSTTRFLHVDFPKCRFSRFLLSVLKSVIAHKKEGRLLDGGSGIGTPP